MVIKHVLGTRDKFKSWFYYLLAMPSLARHLNFVKKKKKKKNANDTIYFMDYGRIE